MRVIASSVRGPAHTRDGRPCQDAWLAVPGENACLAVVADGMGSRPNAREGARAATRAARDAWRVWSRSPVGVAEDLIRLVEVTWRLRLGSIPVESAATTCLLYAEDRHGRAAMAQLGDGLLLRKNGDGVIVVHPSRSGGLGRTDALGTPHRLSDWSFTMGAALAAGEAVLLATDGVSEDLEPARLAGLAAWVIDDLGGRAHPNRALASELRNWPVPHHQDDKTLLVMWKPWTSNSK